MLVLTLDPEIQRHLEALGATNEASKTRLARKALLEALEDMADLRLAEQRLAKPERSWTLDEIERGMTCQVELKETARRELRKLDPATQLRIWGLSDAS